ncbi:HEAT repeat domain-containing protein [Candidatus Uabimicrobium sp. HlEnr_7]|uniref:HEAT repeat domain-containing protein n=1 Tax=Candidatus Uabimicrobium helgolandensis TaxID=3095367 RepID=UPI0035568ED4
MPTLTPEQIARLAKDCVENYLGKEAAQVAITQINLYCEQIPSATTNCAYFINLIKYVDQRGKLDNWLWQLQDLSFTKSWFNKVHISNSSDEICPYKGLEHFTEQDAEYFFGREEYEQNLFADIDKNQKPLVVVVGASGSGKSSIVYAGLIPKLRQTERYIITSCRPGESPFFNLASNLIPLYVNVQDREHHRERAKSLAKSLADDPFSLKREVTQLILEEYPHSYQKLFIFIDQFEEIYTQTTDSIIRNKFLDMIRYEDSPVKNLSIVITMRADFLYQASCYKPFAKAIEQKIRVISPMEKKDIVAAIEGPLQKSNVTIEEALKKYLITRITTEANNLPLLEFALYVLWRNRKNNQLQFSSMEKLGKNENIRGIEGFLVSRAEKIYSQLQEKEKKQLFKAFNQLVHVKENEKYTRRLVTKQDIGDDNWNLLLKFASKEARLVVTNKLNTANAFEEATEVIEVAHESLINSWPRLKEWISLDFDFLSWRERLDDAAAQWKQKEQDPQILLRGSLLEDALSYLNLRNDDLSKSQQNFIEKSKGQRDLEQREREVQSKRLQSLLLFGSTAVIVVAFIAIVGWINANKATKKANKATEKQKKATIEAQINLWTTHLMSPTTVTKFERKRAVKKLIELNQQSTINHFMGYLKAGYKGDGEIRKVILEFFGSAKLENLLELLKEENQNAKELASQDLECIKNIAWKEIISRLKRAQKEKKINQKKHLLFPFRIWKKESLCVLIHRLKEEERNFFLPILIMENFEDLYGTLINEEEAPIVRKKVALFIEQTELIEPFIAKIFYSISERDKVTKEIVISMLSKVWHKDDLIIYILISLLQSKNRYCQGFATSVLKEKIRKKVYPVVEHLTSLLKDESTRFYAAEILGERAVPTLIGLLKSKNEYVVRKSAIGTLGKIGEKAHSAAEYLIPLLRDKDLDIRRATTRALGQIGPTAYIAIEHLIPLLKDKDIKVRCNTIHALGEIGENAHIAIEHFLPLLEGKYKGLVTEALEKIGKKAVPYLISLLKEKDASIRVSAAKTLGEIGKEAHSAVKHLIPLLKDEDTMTSYWAAETLEEIGKEAPLAVKYLIPLLKDEDPMARYYAVKILGKIGKKAMPSLIILLKDKDTMTRYYAEEILGKIGERAVPSLILLLRDKDIRESAIRALGEVGEKGYMAVEHLIPFLKDENETIRIFAIRALGKIGKKAHLAVEHLIPLLEDKNIYIRRLATIAFTKIGKKEHLTVEYLISLLKDKGESVRLGAARALGEIGEKAYLATNSLISLLKDKDESVRLGAARALGEIGEKAHLATNSLISLLKDKDESVRLGAARALGEIGEKAHLATNSLISLLKDKDESVRLGAARALGEIGEKAHLATNSLISLLKDKDELVRLNAMRALGEIGKRVIPSVLPLLKSKNSFVRHYAVEVLQKIVEKEIDDLGFLFENQDILVKYYVLKVLGRIGKKAYPTVEYLIPLLKNKNKEIRISTIVVLRNIGEKAHSSIEHLVPLLKDKDEEIRQRAADALGRIWRGTVPYLISLSKDKWLIRGRNDFLTSTISFLYFFLEDKDESVRLYAKEVIRKIGAEIIPDLIPLLENKNRDVRFFAKETLWGIGKKTDLAINFLIPLLKHENGYVRQHAAKTFGNIGEKAIPSLIALLNDKNVNTKIASAEALGEIGEKSFLAVEELTLLLKDKNQYVKKYVAKTLGKIGEKAHLAVEQLIPLLNDEDETVKQTAIETLGAIGEKASSAVQHFSSVFEDEDEVVKQSAAKALIRIGKKAIPLVLSLLKDKYSRIYVLEALKKEEKLGLIVSSLISLLSDKNQNVKMFAIETLGIIGEKAFPAVEHLIPFLSKDVKQITRKSTVKTLGKIGEKAYPAVKHLLPLLSDKDQNIKKFAIEALGAIGEKAYSAVEHLIPLLNTSEKQVIRKSVVETLGKIGEKAYPAAEHLIPLLKNENEMIKRSAIKALGAIGEKASSAVGHLIPLLRVGENEIIRKSVVETLGVIGKKAYPAVKHLTPLLKEKNMKLHVIEALGGIGERAYFVVEDFMLFLEDEYEDEIIRTATTKALGNLGARVIPKLIGILKDKNAAPIGLLKDENAELIGLLKKNLAVRKSVTNALGKIGEKAAVEIRDFLQKEASLPAIETGYYFFHSYLQQAYIKENKSLILQQDIEFLSQSPHEEHLHTVAMIYAWQRNTKRAKKYAKKALKYTPGKVKLLLERKTPKQLEELVK